MMFIKQQSVILALALLPTATVARLNYPSNLADLADPSHRELKGGCHTCDCFTCDSAVLQTSGSHIGLIKVVVGKNDCKSDSISWMCCTGIDGNQDGADCDVTGGGTCSGQKCETVSSGIEMYVPPFAKSVTINTHDGKTSGDGNNIYGVCGGSGNQGGSCKAPTAHCELEFDLAKCGGNDDPTPPVASSYGDPHVRTWGGDTYDFHGACDLVLVDAPKFDNEKGLSVHIRTKIHSWWSYIDSAAIQIGNDTLEVKGGKDQSYYWINGQAGTLTDSGIVESKVNGYPIKFTSISKKQSRFQFQDLPQGVGISLETYSNFVRVNIRGENKRQFDGALGLLGSFPTGKKIARDGKTIIQDANDFGQEWQVRPAIDEERGSIFHNMEGVQHPQKCQMPSTTASETSRRLGESQLDLEDAKLACARVTHEDFDACVFDVLATNDLDLAGSY